MMGSPDSETDRENNEGPRHQVTLRGFKMSKYEVTFAQYDVFCEATGRRKPSDNGWGRGNRPVINVDWNDATAFAQWMGCRLPTEAEWEYACRAGTTTAFWWGDNPDDVEKYEWYADNADFKYQKVGTKKPNPWGLYDMHGNVAEWVLDAYTADGYQLFKDQLQIDPWNVAKTLYPRTARGGSWDDYQESMRSAARRGSNPEWKMQDPQLPKSIWYLTDAQVLGMRVVRPLKVPSKEEMALYWNNLSERD